MASTIIEKIITSHSGRKVSPGQVVDFVVDVRVARDFGGANVVKAIRDNGLAIDNPERTYFTFDCNPTGSDQRYAANQQVCRVFARERGIGVYDVNRGIGTHLAIEEGLVAPGRTLVSTDSHANLVGAVGAFGQGMGDQDIAHAFAFGSVWFGVPATVKVAIEGRRAEGVTAKDLTLALLGRLGSRGLLGLAAELYGSVVDKLTLSERMTMASMGTEMGAISVLFPPSSEIAGYCQRRSRWPFEPVLADADAIYKDEIVLEISDVKPMIARPGRPDDVVPVREVKDRPVDSVFIGSCTNGTFDDMVEAARVLDGRRVDAGVVLKIVPATDAVWRECLEKGLVSTFKKAGAMFGSSGCAGCADGQIGQNGPGEVTVSTGNRNFRGKQGLGDVYLASPSTAAASAVAGSISTADFVLRGAYEARSSVAGAKVYGIKGRRDAVGGGRVAPSGPAGWAAGDRKSMPRRIAGRVWVLNRDDVDTDMIYHNRHLAVTDVGEMGRYAFGGLEGWGDFPSKVKQGDIIVTGRNFGCGSSRQHAVDCFKSLGVGLIVARSFGAIYERNAINAGLPVVTAELSGLGLRDGDEIVVDLVGGLIEAPSRGIIVRGSPFSRVQMDIYQRGGLLKGR